MSSQHVFISHASADDEFVKALRRALEGHKIPVWVDSRNLRGGAKLAREIEQAIEQVRQVIVVLSPHTVNSAWVRLEIKKALEVEKQRKDEGYRVVPLLLPGIEPSALPMWFDEEPLSVRIQLKLGGLSEAMPAILAALEERLPTDNEPMQKVEAAPVEELLLTLTDPKIQTRREKPRVIATATLSYHPANPAARSAESKRFTFTAPLGPIETDELRWYLESYYLWPTGVFKGRAERIEAQLPEWGKSLFKATLAKPAVQEILKGWLSAGDRVERRFSVLVDRDLPEGSNKRKQAIAWKAASELLSLPWELLHDSQGYLFQGANPVRVRRRLPNRYHQPVALAALPIRILLVSPRPEDEHISYIDHRAGALPLVKALETLGDMVELTVLTPPTFPAMEQTLLYARKTERPFHVVHFDGHGSYDRKLGLGGLCFEDPKDAQKLHRRAMQLVYAEALASVMRNYRIPLMFLEACKSAKFEDDLTASVAAKLLEAGVTSVVAMSHSVLVETAWRFVEAFYEELARGSRVGQAMLAGQRVLKGDTYRTQIMGVGALHLEDWFVPVLYQEQQDPQLFTGQPPEVVLQHQEKQHRLSLGDLPEPPAHRFIGRSRELLAIERLLYEHPYAVVRGPGGMGKTTLAAEFARWLVRTHRYQRAAFVSIEVYSDARTILDSLGRQLLPEGENWSIAQYPNIQQALQPVLRALTDHSTLIVLDNMESILPDATGQGPPGAILEEVFELCNNLLQAASKTRLVFTSREAMPAPYSHKGREISLGALGQKDAIELVSQVMAQAGLVPKPDDPGSTPQEIIDLVEAVNCHTRALVLLAREVSHKGVRATTENVHQLMAALHHTYPDDRENSLYASVELSLRRLEPTIREQIHVLSVFHGGTSLYVLEFVLDQGVEKAQDVARALIKVGLGEYMGHGYIRLDPALPPYLLRGTTATDQEQMKKKWAAGIIALIYSLNKQSSEEASLVTPLTRLESPNLLAFLGWLEAKSKEVPELVVQLASLVENLLSRSGYSKVLAKAITVREKTARALEEWSADRCLAESLSVARLLERGNIQAAYTAAQQLLQRCLGAGEEAYQGAAYDIAKAYQTLGNVLLHAGAADAALQPLSEALQRFQGFADAGNSDAEGMISLAMVEYGDCLRDLGQLNEAEIIYMNAFVYAARVKDERQKAVSRVHHASLLMLKKRYTDALKIYTEVRELFQTLDEPESVANIWHHIGMAHNGARQFDQAEQALRQALAIWVQQKAPEAEAASLGALGLLYEDMGRLQEAATFHWQAADIYAKQHNLYQEGRTRTNLGGILIRLQHYDKARCELHRALECGKDNHASQPWVAWNHLYLLEQAINNPQAAVHARQQVMQSYLAYRRAGGESQHSNAFIYAFVAQSIQQGDTSKVEQYLAQNLKSKELATDIASWVATTFPKLLAILHGDRNPALADDPNLAYEDAVELLQLLEQLNEQSLCPQESADSKGDLPISDRIRLFITR